LRIFFQNNGTLIIFCRFKNKSLQISMDLVIYVEFEIGRLKMRITALEKYGLRCMLALANEGPEKQLSIPEIAEKEGLSIPYTSKLLSILRKAQLVKAIRGRKGGFCISRSPKSINLLEIITALGGPLIEPMHCSKFSGQMETCVHLEKCSVMYVFSGLAGYIGDYLHETSLDDILNGNILEKVKRIRSNVHIDNKDSFKELINLNNSFKENGSEFTHNKSNSQKGKIKKD